MARHFQGWPGLLGCVLQDEFGNIDHAGSSDCTDLVFGKDSEAFNSICVCLNHPELDW